MKEDKQKICDFLCTTLRETRDQGDLKELIYDSVHETVSVIYEGSGKRVVNVAMDSGVAMIRDILRSL